eukprot:COSAG01_NODE_580_length_15231_cov_6.793220_13_plen_86_part_00
MWCVAVYVCAVAASGLLLHAAHHQSATVRAVEEVTRGHVKGTCADPRLESPRPATRVDTSACIDKLAPQRLHLGLFALPRSLDAR